MAVGIGNQRIALVDLQTEQPRRIIENVDARDQFRGRRPRSSHPGFKRIKPGASLR